MRQHFLFFWENKLPISRASVMLKGTGGHTLPRGLRCLLRIVMTSDIFKISLINLNQYRYRT